MMIFSLIALPVLEILIEANASLHLAGPDLVEYFRFGALLPLLGLLNK
jgi:hypothetical protein